MSLEKQTLHIRGMHCRSCELLLEDSIGSVPGIKRVRTNFKKGIAEFHYEGTPPNKRELEAAVIAAGYSLGMGEEEKKQFFSRNFEDYVELTAAVALLFIIYIVLDTLGILNLNFSPNTTSGLIGVLIVGLTAGVSTCMALVGGLVLGISSRHADLHPEATAVQKFRPHVFFNIGRLVPYALLGGVIGLLGSALKISSSVIGMLTLVLGFVMLFLGLKLIDIFPRLHNATISLPKGVSRMLGLTTEVKEYSHRGAFLTGALTFFVPCGFTQAMQLYAVSTGSFTQGALIMGMFALGTLPGLVGIGGLTSVVKGAFARYFFKFAGVIVILLALFNISSGYNLTGWNFASLGKFYEESAGNAGAVARMENGKQIVEMTQVANGYNPRQLTVKKGIPVVWKIKSTTQYTCAAYISMPAASISQPLKLGENIIEFTPTKTGTMKFTCSMGMYSGTFTVVE